MNLPERQFVSYAFQLLSRKKIKKYSAQYRDVDMAAFLEDAENIPFLLRNDPLIVSHGGEEYAVMIWNAFNGLMVHCDEDSVRNYATVKYLRERGYAIFESVEDVEAYAANHSWPRKSRQAN
jgi:hypothetical protein